MPATRSNFHLRKSSFDSVFSRRKIRDRHFSGKFCGGLLFCRSIRYLERAVYGKLCAARDSLHPIFTRIQYREPMPHSPVDPLFQSLSISGERHGTERVLTVSEAA